MSRVARAASTHSRRRSLIVVSAALALCGGIGVAASSSIPARDGSTAREADALSRAFPPGSRPCSGTPTRQRYVSPAGRDSNPGTLKRPWRTIPRALRAARPGDAIYARAGTYPDWAVAAQSGTASAAISLRAYPGEHPVITGRLKIEGAYFCVSGFVFQGRTAANETGVLVYVSGGDFDELSRNEIRDAALSGIYVGDPENDADHLYIIGNYIHDNGTHTNLDHGIYFGSGGNGLIANNIVVGNLAIGVKVAPEANNVIVTQNTIVRNGSAGVVVGGEETWSSNDVLVVNNIVAFNDRWGIRTYWENAVGSGNVALRNLVFANGKGAFWFPLGGMVQQQSILRDPSFLSADDYRLRRGSPAIDRAIPAYSMSFDFNGRSRPPGTRPDLGAFER
jgi:hypothetical protein